MNDHHAPATPALDPIEFARHDILRDPMDNASWCPQCDEEPPCRWNRLLAAYDAQAAQLAAVEELCQRWIAECCGAPPRRQFCESYGCSSLLDILAALKGAPNG